MVQHIRWTLSLQWCRGPWEIPLSNKKMGCLTHQPSMCSAWSGQAQLTALSSWKPQLGLTVMCPFYDSQGQVLCSAAASCMLPVLAHLHELLRSEKTSRASPSPPSRKLQTVAYGQLSSPCRLAMLPGSYKQHRRVMCSTMTSPGKPGSRYSPGAIMSVTGREVRGVEGLFREGQCSTCPDQANTLKEKAEKNFP